MKFAIINDPHIGPADSGYFKGVQRKLVAKSEKILKQIINKLNIKEFPEFVVNLGDTIEDVNNRTIDIQSFNRAIKIFSQLKSPTHWLIGNHDIRTLTEKEIAKMLELKQMYYSFDHGSYHFVALSFELTGDHTRNLEDITAKVPKEQINWLKVDLSKTQKPTIIFIHYPLSDTNLKGNFWFESQPNKALISNRQQVRKVLKESKKVKAVFSAHQHWNKMNIHNGIPYFTVTSLIENFNNDGIPSEAYTIINLEKDEIKVDVKGNDPAQFNFRFT